MSRDASIKLLQQSPTRMERKENVTNKQLVANNFFIIWNDEFQKKT
jgi:hypothetical protein